MVPVTKNVTKKSQHPLLTRILAFFTFFFGVCWLLLIGFEYVF
jgi:hypothetical protein